MRLIHKILGIALLVAALVYGVITGLGHMRVGVRVKSEEKDASKHSLRDQDSENASDEATRTMRVGSRKLSRSEATEFLKKTIIPEINFENILLDDALKIVNEEIAKQTPNDQPRPRILMSRHDVKDPEVKSSEDEFIDIGRIPLIADLRLRKVPADVLLKYTCEMTKNTYWFYKGDFYFDPGDCSCRSQHFYSEELLSRIKLENVDASELSSKLGEIIEQHDYFGPKIGINVYTTMNARDSILNGTIKLPRIDVDLHDISLEQAVLKIAEQSNGALQPHYKGLIFNPLNEKLVDKDPFSSTFNPNGASASVILDESIFKPESDPLNNSGSR